MGLLKNLLESVAGIDLNKVKEAINNMAAEQGANQSADPGRKTPSYQQPRQPQQPWQSPRPNGATISGASSRRNSRSSACARTSP